MVAEIYHLSPYTLTQHIHPVDTDITVSKSVHEVADGRLFGVKKSCHGAQGEDQADKDLHHLWMPIRDALESSFFGYKFMEPRDLASLSSTCRWLYKQLHPVVICDFFHFKSRHLPFLRVLDLCHCTLSGHFERLIPQLEILRLDNVHFNVQNLNTFCPRLQTLSLRQQRDLVPSKYLINFPRLRHFQLFYAARLYNDLQKMLLFLPPETLQTLRLTHSRVTLDILHQLLLTFQLHEFMVEYRKDRDLILSAVHPKLRKCSRVDERWGERVVSFFKFETK